jgi:hypothetical protein
MVARGRDSTSDNHCANDRSICVRWHGVNQFLARRNIHGTFKQTGLRNSSRQLLSLRNGRDRCDSPRQGAGPQMILAALIMRCAPTIHELIVLTLPPAIAVLSTGCRPLGSCSRAAGWSAATSCLGTNAKCRLRRAMSEKAAQLAWKPRGGANRRFVGLARSERHST